MHYAPSVPTPTTQTSVLASLRSLIPTRDSITFNEALRVAELQASRLLSLFEIDDGPAPSELITELPRVQVVYDDLPVSGTSHWNGHDWVITLNQAEGRLRQRFTLMHEFKHVIDHGHTRRLYTGNSGHSAAMQAERAADYFAACVLMSRRLLKRAWGDGIQHPADLARHFDVSIPAMTVRLSQTGLVPDSDRCARPIRSDNNVQQFRPIRRYA